MNCFDLQQFHRIDQAQHLCQCKAFFDQTIDFERIPRVDSPVKEDLHGVRGYGLAGMAVEIRRKPAISLAGICMSLPYPLLQVAPARLLRCVRLLT